MLGNGEDCKGCLVEGRLLVQKPAIWTRLVISVQIPFEHLFSISLRFKGLKVIHVTKIKLLVLCLY